MAELYTSTSKLIIDSVRKMYEAFPYPNYPLLVKPKWQEGYLASSKFAGKLYEDLCGHESAIHASRGQYVRYGRSVLVAGAGEALPYVIRKFEPSQHRLLCVDLSARNLRRARFRLWSDFRPTEFIRAELNQFLRQQAPVSGPYNHIDIYGVLHHLSNPVETIHLLTSHLSPHGTMRVMVYNKPSRNWIHHLQHVVKLLKLDLYEKADRDFFRTLLQRAREESPTLQEKLSQMGDSTLKIDSRLVDTFFHAREARVDISRWFKIFEQSGLRPFALIDRYGELDDLPNPLWQVPAVAELEKRAAEGIYANNLELYLCRIDNRDKRGKSKYEYEQATTWPSLLPFLIKAPPRRWFEFDETTETNWRTKLKLWHQFIFYTAKYRGASFESLRKLLTMTAMQRLARIGAILPGQITDPNLKRILLDPITHERPVPAALAKIDFESSKTLEFIAARLRARDEFSERRLSIIKHRLNKAQL